MSMNSKRTPRGTWDACPIEDIHTWTRWESLVGPQSSATDTSSTGWTVLLNVLSDAPVRLIFIAALIALFHNTRTSGARVIK